MIIVEEKLWDKKKKKEKTKMIQLEMQINFTFTIDFCVFASEINKKLRIFLEKNIITDKSNLIFILLITLYITVFCYFFLIKIYT